MQPNRFAITAENTAPDAQQRYRKRIFEATGCAGVDELERFLSIRIKPQGEAQRLIWVDRDACDDLWSRGRDYISPGGFGAVNEDTGDRRRWGSRYEKVLWYLEQLREGRSSYLEVPYLHVETGRAVVGTEIMLEGRHRFAVLRDTLLERIPVCVKPELLSRLNELGIGFEAHRPDRETDGWSAV